MTNKSTHNDVSITPDTITLRFGNMEPVIIPRASLRTRIQLIAWVYRLTGWPGMNRCRLRTFIAAIFAHHGWALPESNDNALVDAAVLDATGEALLQTAAGI